MGVNFDKIRQQIKEAEQAKSFKDRVKPVYFNVKPGTHKVRIMPPFTQDEDSPHAGLPHVVWALHWLDVGGKRLPFACPLQTKWNTGDKTCPICQEKAKLRATRDPEDAELAKSLHPRDVTLVNVVDLRDPVYTESDVETWEAENEGRTCHFKDGDTKVQVWSMGQTLKGQLNSLFVDNLDVTDLETGFNLKLVRKGKGQFDTEYNLTLDIVGGKVEATPFEFVSDKPVEEVLYKLDKVYEFFDKDTLSKALRGENPFALPEDKETKSLPRAKVVEEDEEEVVVSPPKSSKLAKTNPSPKVNSARAAILADIQEDVDGDDA